MSYKTYSNDEILTTFVTSKQIDSPLKTRAMDGLSDELIAELSTDNTTDGIIVLISIETEPDKWYNVTSNATEILKDEDGNIILNERGNATYKTTYNGVDYLYYPFEYTMTSDENTGVINVGGLRLLNYSKEIAEAFEKSETALKVQITTISKRNKELISVENNLVFNNITNTVGEISGDLVYRDITNERIPSLKYYPKYFKQ